MIDYDRLTLGGSRPYYVSFNNVDVGKLIGQGFVQCVKAWHVSKPQVIVMHGDVTDNNATLFYQGYNSVLAPKFKSGAYTNASATASTPPAPGTPPTALTEFQTAFTAHSNGERPWSTRTTTRPPGSSTYLNPEGHQAELGSRRLARTPRCRGCRPLLAGYQCGTVYKPIYLEAQAAVAIATYLRAGMTPPKALINGTTADLQSTTSRSHRRS